MLLATYLQNSNKAPEGDVQGGTSNTGSTGKKVMNTEPDSDEDASPETTMDSTHQDHDIDSVCLISIIICWLSPIHVIENKVFTGKLLATRGIWMIIE